MKEQFELEYLLKTSPKVLESKVATASGLGEWFADDVNIKDDVYIFEWDGNKELATLLFHKPNQRIRFKWLTEDGDDEEDVYFEISHQVDPMTQMTTLLITDFAYPEDKESSILMWEQQVADLRRLIGA